MLFSAVHMHPVKRTQLVCLGGLVSDILKLDILRKFILSRHFSRSALWIRTIS